MKATAFLTVAGNSVSSSLLPLTTRHGEVAPRSAGTGTVEVAVETIDSLAEELQWRARSYLKIDTQGYELEVLRGAVSTLEECAAIELELSLVELYDAQPLMPDVVQWLLQHRFVAIAIWPSFVGADGDVLQMDAIFVRPVA